MSPRGKYTDSIDGVQVRDDGVHFTRDGSVLVDKWLAPQLEAAAKGAPPADRTANAEQYDPRKLKAV